MSPVKRINTRELLRNFKTVKAHLVSGEVQQVLIDIGEDCELELAVRRHRNSGKNIAKMLREMKKPIYIKRTNVFDDFLQPRDDRPAT